MAFTTWSLTGNLADLIGTDLTPDKIVLYLSPSADVFTDGATEVRVGDIAADVADDGAFTIAGIPDSTTTLISYKAIVRWQSADGGRPAGMTSDWFNVTANTTLAAKWEESVILTPVDATVVANIEAAAALGATNDTATASFVNNAASATSAALADGFPARVSPTKHAPALGLYFPEAEGGKTATHIQAAIDAMPGDTSSAGGTLVLSEGDYTIASTVVIAKPGVKIESTGGYTAQVYANPALTGAAFKFAIPSTYLRGSIVRNIALRMSGSSADGIVFEGAYDQTILDNVYVDGFTGASSAFKFIPAAGAPSDISQTILATNCAAWAAAGHTGSVWYLRKVQEATFVGCKGLSGNELGTGISYFLEDCRGVSFYNCSAGKSNAAWRVATLTRPSGGININNPTIEGSAYTLIATGAATREVTRLSLTNVRPQIASTLSAGPITMEYVIASLIEAQGLTLTMDANCTQNHVYSEDGSKVTDNGTFNTVIAWGNANKPAIVKNSLGLGVEAASGPKFRHSVTGRTGYYESLWSASSGADNGYFLRYTADGSTFRNAQFIEPDLIKQHWYVYDGAAVVEAMRIERLPASAKTGLWLLANNGTTTTLKQVELGAADSGGAGFRMLRVAN